MRFILMVLVLSVNLFADVWVRGYLRSDGTYVQGHYRTEPNATTRDNYSTYPNINPHTGQQGTQRFDYNARSSYQYQSDLGSPYQSNLQNRYEARKSGLYR
jgi:hypothetical protein